jgi:hypothetical protein
MRRVSSEAQARLSRSVFGTAEAVPSLKTICEEASRSTKVLGLRFLEVKRLSCWRGVRGFRGCRFGKVRLLGGEAAKFGEDARGDANGDEPVGGALR